MAVEEPKFQTVLKDGAFEVRDYPQLVVAEVTVTGDQTQAASKGFRLLAGYIFGGNTGGKSIAMTAPVAQTPQGEEIPMTAPVAQGPVRDAWVVRFTMPGAYSLEALPAPKDRRVHLQAVPPARFAVLRFSGVAGPGNLGVKTIELLALAKAHHLKPRGPVTLAQYNPPWTLWFLRRNEVMVGVDR